MFPQMRDSYINFPLETSSHNDEKKERIKTKMPSNNRKVLFHGEEQKRGTIRFALWPILVEHPGILRDISLIGGR